MMALGKTVLAALGIGPRVVYQSLSAWSLRAAIREQRLTSLCDRLRQVVPDVRDHYTGAFGAQEYQRYWEVKIRGLQAFQVRCMLDALEIIEGGSLVVAEHRRFLGEPSALHQGAGPAGHSVTAHRRQSGSSRGGQGACHGRRGGAVPGRGFALSG